jgi:hypothetical protein
LSTSQWNADIVDEIIFAVHVEQWCENEIIGFVLRSDIIAM